MNFEHSFLILICLFISACGPKISTLNVFAIPETEDQHQRLKQYAHQTIAAENWSSLCDAPRAEIDAKITLLGYEKGWDQDRLDKIRAQELARIDETQEKYAPKPKITLSNLKSDKAIGTAIRELETYDQFWASAIFRYSEFGDIIPQDNRGVFGLLFNRMQCEEQTKLLPDVKSILSLTSDFLTDDQFGEGTERSLFYITQHADGDIEFQVRMLKLFQENPSNLPPPAIAMLTDRVKINQGRLQIYGSQLQCIDGKYKPKPVENIVELDERRASVGLEPFEDYAAGTPGCGNSF